MRAFRGAKVPPLPDVPGDNPVFGAEGEHDLQLQRVLQHRARDGALCITVTFTVVRSTTVERNYLGGYALRGLETSAGAAALGALVTALEALHGTDELRGLMGVTRDAGRRLLGEGPDVDSDASVNTLRIHATVREKQTTSSRRTMKITWRRFGVPPALRNVP